MLRVFQHQQSLSIRFELSKTVSLPLVQADYHVIQTACFVRLSSFFVTTLR